jgi:hypothetical protein
VTSKAELPNKAEKKPVTPFGRDCGYSALLPTSPPRTFWLFCDTPIYNSSGKETAFIHGSTAAWQEIKTLSNGIPKQLEEIKVKKPAPPPDEVAGGAYQFLPSPKNVYLPPLSGRKNSPKRPACNKNDGNPNGNDDYSASWPSGVAVEPSKKSALIVYDEVCVYNDAGTSKIRVEGLGVAEYDWVSQEISKFHDVYTPPDTGAALPDEEQLSSPVFVNDKLYMFSGSHNVGVDVATVGAVTELWNPKLKIGFAPQSTPGASPFNPSLVSAGTNYPGHPGVVMIVGSEVDANAPAWGTGYTIWENKSADPSKGTWVRLAINKPIFPDCADTKTSTHSFPPCRAVIGHPELSNADKMFVSVFDSTILPINSKAAEGHVRMAELNYPPK